MRAGDSDTHIVLLGGGERQPFNTRMRPRVWFEPWNSVHHVRKPDALRDALTVTVQLDGVMAGGMLRGTLVTRRS